jgi:lysophospholipase L1-like esterase
MKFSWPSTRLPLIAILAASIVFPSLVFAQGPDTAGRPINLLVIGDSILWGQGLKDEHKAWHQVKGWLEQTTGRKVNERIEAHSGAVIGTAEDPPRTETAVGGEVNRAVPTVHEQLDDAVRSYADPAQVDLVLVDGCINDIDARRLLNAANTPAGIRELAQAKCGAPVEALLERVASSFPNAQVILTGYYPIISEKTSNDLFMRGLSRRLYTPESGEPHRSDKELRQRLIGISKEWYQSSNEKLATAANTVDAKLSVAGSRRRVLFAGVSFSPEYGFGAYDSRLWGFDASFLRKMLVIFAFGKVSIRTNDEARSLRSTSCKEAFKGPAGETKDEKRAREWRIMLCNLAAIGHPNRKGAAMYTEAIGRQLKSLLDAGWLRDTRKAAPVAVAP